MTDKYAAAGTAIMAVSVVAIGLTVGPIGAAAAIALLGLLFLCMTVLDL